MYGQTIAFIGIALCVILCGTGSAIGLFKTGSASAAVHYVTERMSASGYLRLMATVST